MIKGLRYIYARSPAYFDLTGNLLQDGDLSSDFSNSISINIQPLYETILKYIIFSICSVHRGKFRHFWRAISGQTQWKELLEDVEKAEKNALRNIRTIHGSKLLAVTRDLTATYTSIIHRGDEQRRRDFLYSLKGMDYPARLNNTQRRLDGTCQWFRKHSGFTRWLSNSESLLLVSAGAGCGKSVLAKYLIEELLYEEDDTVTICYFFFKDDTEARSCLNASKAILHALLEANPTFVDACMQELPSNLNNISDTDVWNAFDRFSRVQGMGKIVCVLDALDESNPHERDGFINRLKDYVAKNHRTPGARFVVTTRGYPQIINLFHSFSSSKVDLDGDGDEEKRQIQEEIGIVMDHRLNNLENTMPDASISLRETIRDELAKNGTEQRTYLWMHLMFDCIKKTRRHSPREWLELLQNLPDSVDEAYEKLLQSVTPPAREKVRTLLALILAAERPLTIAELCIAVTCRIDTLESRTFDPEYVANEHDFGVWIRWECGSFVTLYDGKAFLIHQTAKEFLLDKTVTNHGYWQGSMTEHVIHKYMAESCISFLSIGKFRLQEYINLQAKTSGTGSDVFGNILAEALAFEPFVIYSAVNWIYHFQKCQQLLLPDCQVVDVGEEFFDLYLNLFIQKEGGSYRSRGEWTQRAWYCIMMATKPAQVFPDLDEKKQIHRLLWLKSFTVSNIACLFDHRRLLAFALDVLEEDTNHMTGDNSFQPTESEYSLLLPHFAACGSSSWCLNDLQARGYSMDLQDGDGQTPLHKAMLQGNAQIIEMLLKAGASKTTEDNWSRTPLIYGIMVHANWARKYIASASKDESEMRSLLYFSVIAELPDFLDLISRDDRRLLVSGLRDPSGGEYDRLFQKALLIARSRCAISQMHSMKADLGFLYGNSATALHLSVQKEERIFTMIFLVEHRDDMVYAIDGSGNTPLHMATQANNVLAIAHLLFHTRVRAAHKNLPGEGGDTPLHMASRMGHREAAEILMSAGVDVDIRNDDGLTALELDRPAGLGVGLAELIRNRGATDMMHARFLESH